MPTVDIPSGEHGLTGYLAVPDSGRGPGVIVIQEWWGIVPHIRSVADRLAAAATQAAILGDQEGARDFLERAVGLDPTDDGIAYELAERPDEALASYRAALQLDPELFLSDLAVQRLSGE